MNKNLKVFSCGVEFSTVKSEGQMLRSTSDLVQYCATHNLKHDESLNIFLKQCTISNIVKLKKLLKTQAQIHQPEANIIDVLISKNNREAVRPKKKKTHIRLKKNYRQ